VQLTKYFLKRIGASIFVLFGVSIVIFLIARAIPGDPARMALGPRASSEMVEQLRERLHLNDSIPVQYYHFLRGVSEGDLGISLYTKRPVVKDLAEYFPATFELVIFSGLIMVGVGIPLGIISARHQDRLTDSVARIFALLGVVTPTFVWAIFFMLIFAYWLDFLPIMGRLSETVSPPPHVTGMYAFDALFAGQWHTFKDALSHIVMPAGALALSGLGQAARLTRTNMLESFGRPYIEMARAYNFSELQTSLKYALKPAMIPTLTILGLDFAVMLGNAFLVEKVFAWGGLAQYGVEAIFYKDLNAIVGTVLVIAMFFLIVNMIIDLVVAYLNPRIRLG